MIAGYVVFIEIVYIIQGGGEEFEIVMLRDSGYLLVTSNMKHSVSKAMYLPTF